MKFFNVVYIAILAVVAIAASVFVVKSRNADSYMQATVRHSVTPPQLRPLHHGHRNHVRVKDTPKNRARYSSWVIDPGDGYLYSAWWE
jgi:hypothetical protein